MILVADANVLIDLDHVGGLPVLPRLAPTEVLDLVLDECEDYRAGLASDALASGVKVVASEEAWVFEAQAVRTGALSLEDAVTLYYAQAFGRALLTGDGPLRDRARELGVDVHGTIWIVEEAHRRALVTPDDLCNWIKAWPLAERRLPREHLIRLARKLRCLK